MPFDETKIKRYFNMMLKIAIVVTLIWGFFSLATFITTTGSYNVLQSSDFVMFIALIILEWIGWMLLSGKFKPQPLPPNRRQQRVPYSIQQPQRPPQNYPRPIQIKVETCIVCNKEKQLHSLREFKDCYGNSIFVCEEHI